MFSVQCETECFRLRPCLTPSNSHECMLSCNFSSIYHFLAILQFANRDALLSVNKARLPNPGAFVRITRRVSLECGETQKLLIRCGHF